MKQKFQVPVIKGKVRRIAENQQGISNNRAGEVKESFVQSAVRANYLNCKSVQAWLRDAGFTEKE